MATAFQRSAFQNSAFQIDAEVAVQPQPSFGSGWTEPRRPVRLIVQNASVEGRLLKFRTRLISGEATGNAYVLGQILDARLPKPKKAKAKVARPRPELRFTSSGIYDKRTGSCLFYRGNGSGSNWFFEMGTGRPAFYVSNGQLFRADGRAIAA